MTVDPRDALALTLEVFDLSAAQIASLSGVQESSISRYRKKKKDVNSLTLKAIIDALPNEARDFYFELVQKGRATARSRVGEFEIQYRVG